MDCSLGKRSCLTSGQRFEQQLTLPRGHTSEITDVKRRGGPRGLAHCGRRTFTFKGSAAKRAASQSNAKQRTCGHSPTSSRNTSLMRADILCSARSRRMRSTSKVRTPATLRSRSRSTVRQTASQRPLSKPPSRAASTSGSVAGSRKASSEAAEPILPPPAAVMAAPPEPEPHEVIEQPLSPPEFIKTEESRLVSSPPKSTESESPEVAEVEQPQPNVTIEMPRSPSLVGYRKVMYSEDDHKWVAYWKMVEDEKRAQERKRLEVQMAKVTNRQVPAPHKVKGRTTAKMQLMFPTAIIKPDRRTAFVHSINMTDPLRLELHKRKAPIVPTFYQEHILRYGKLPFRNNPRPHPVI